MSRNYYIFALGERYHRTRDKGTPGGTPAACACGYSAQGNATTLAPEHIGLHEFISTPRAPCFDDSTLLAYLAAEFSRESEKPKPIAMRLFCGDCGNLHIDEGEFATKPHHTHACQFCGNVWRPAIVNTVGVRFLPGFKNEVE